MYPIAESLRFDCLFIFILKFSFIPYLFVLGIRLTQSVSTKNMHKYFQINVNNKKLFLHKATAACYLQDRQSRLSSDRLRRVQLSKF